MKILALDPGKSNMAWAILEDGKPIDVGMINHVVDELTPNKFNGKHKKFRREIIKLLDRLDKDDVIIAERFQMRMFNSGTQVECVSMMLGIIAAHAKNPFYLVIAGTWKNYMLKSYGENVMEIVFQDRWNEHECDAVGISLWYYETVITEKPNKWLSQFFPLPKNCSTCWYKTLGCKGVEKNICSDYMQNNKRVKCSGCKSFDDCYDTVKEEYGKTHANKVNKTRWGCEEFDPIKKKKK